MAEQWSSLPPRTKCLRSLTVGMALLLVGQFIPYVEYGYFGSVEGHVYPMGSSISAWDAFGVGGTWVLGVGIALVAVATWRLRLGPGTVWSRRVLWTGIVLLAFSVSGDLIGVVFPGTQGVTMAYYASEGNTLASNRAFQSFVGTPAFHRAAADFAEIARIRPYAPLSWAVGLGSLIYGSAQARFVHYPDQPDPGDTTDQGD